MIYETPPVGDEERAAIGRIYELRDRIRPYVAEGRRRWVGVTRRMLASSAIQGSNSIEGYKVSDEDALAVVEGDPPVEPATEARQAVEGYQRAMTFVLQQAENPEFRYSAQLIQSLHFMMTEHALLDSSPGLWRPGEISVWREATNERVYMGPDASLVSGLVAELVAHLEEDTDTPALISAAMAHLNLVMIHPFRDGNGRMARCMQTLVLARERVIAQEYSSIEEYLGKETPSYYEILANVGQGRWSPRGDARPWVQFCLKAHFVQMMTVHRIVSETEEMWRQLVDVAKTNRIPDRALVILLRATRGLKIKNSSYRAALRAADEEISIPTATSDLAAMVRAGLLVQHGIKRGAYYEAGKPLLKIRHAFLESRTPIDTSDLFTSQGDLFTTSAATTAGTIWPPQLSWQSQTAGRGGA